MGELREIARNAFTVVEKVPVVMEAPIDGIARPPEPIALVVVGVACFPAVAGIEPPWVPRIVIAGIALDTADYGGPPNPAGSGPRWRAEPLANLGDGTTYVVRHPAGL